MPTEDIFFALKGHINGNEGEYALNCAGQQLEDGWYYLLPGESDGVGPFKTRDEAKREFEKIKFPKWTMAEILDALVSGKFGYMECQDFRDYPSVTKGTVIARDWDGYEVLVSPVPKSDRISIEAQDAHGNSFTMNSVDGEWVKL